MLRVAKRIAAGSIRSEWQAMDRNLDDLADAQGGTERIKNTPMPKQYDFFPMLFVQNLLPVVADRDGGESGVVYAAGVDPCGIYVSWRWTRLGGTSRTPLITKCFDVPLTAITRTIEINLRQLLGELELPEAEKPVRGVLW